MHQFHYSGRPGGTEPACASQHATRCSIKTCSVAFLGATKYLPTAQTLFGLRPETEERVCWYDPGAGLETTLHLTPFQCSIKPNSPPSPFR